MKSYSSSAFHIHADLAVPMFTNLFISTWLIAFHALQLKCSPGYFLVAVRDLLPPPSQAIYISNSITLWVNKKNHFISPLKLLLVTLNLWPLLLWGKVFY